MSDWMRGDYSFGVPSAFIKISDRWLTKNYPEFLPLLHIANKPDDNLGKIVKELTAIIEKERPEFKGLSVIGLSFNLSSRYLQVLCIHQNFARSPDGIFSSTVAHFGEKVEPDVIFNIDNNVKES